MHKKHEITIFWKKGEFDNKKMKKIQYI